MTMREILCAAMARRPPMPPRPWPVDAVLGSRMVEQVGAAAPGSRPAEQDQCDQLGVSDSEEENQSAGKKRAKKRGLAGKSKRTDEELSESHEDVSKKKSRGIGRSDLPSLRGRGRGRGRTADRVTVDEEAPAGRGDGGLDPGDVTALAGKPGRGKPGSGKPGRGKPGRGQPGGGRGCGRGRGRGARSADAAEAEAEEEAETARPAKTARPASGSGGRVARGRPKKSAGLDLYVDGGESSADSEFP